MAAKGRIKDQWREQRLFEQRAIFAGVVILLMTGALLARLAWLQVLRNDYYSELAQGNRVRIEPLPAALGFTAGRGPDAPPVYIDAPAATA